MPTHDDAEPSLTREDVIKVAMLARLSPLGVVVSAVFFAALASGAREMTFEPNHVPDKLVEVMRGLVVLLAVGYGVADARFAKRPA